MTGRSQRSTPPVNHYLQTSVHGLEAGRSHARKAQRRRRRRNLVVTTLLSVVAAAAIGGAGWFAYSAYVEHDTQEQREIDRRVAEIERQRAGRTTNDIIEELEQTPAWNGPGNPTFGVGSDTGTP